MRISILGCGYVGLVTGACLAEVGHEVVCTDNDEAKIRSIRQGLLPIYEPGLDRIIDRNVTAKHLSFTADLGDAIRFGEAIFICVGTPPLPDGDADLSAIDSVARLIAAEARGPKLVIEKSTVPTESGQKLKKVLSIYARNAGSRYSFSVASNPEFLREGTAVFDFLHPDRIVIGVEDEADEGRLREIYRPIVERSFGCPVHNGACPEKSAPALLVTSINSAELIKHASNTFLAMKISYANLIADICEATSGDAEQVVQAMGLDPRIGSSFLRPGLGFGGFCLPKDVQAFIKVGERAGVDMALLRNVEAINIRRVDQFLHKAQQAMWVLKHKRIGVLGLAFKPETDDIRFAPALDLIRKLSELKAEVQAYDPQAMKKAQAELPAITYCESAYDAATDVDALMIATDWDEFKCLDWERMKQLMARPLILDGRNLLTAKVMAGLGFEYHGVGRAAPDVVHQQLSK